MASLNKVQIIGNVTKDTELRYTPSGSAVVSLSVATNRSWKSKDSGERQEETEFHRVVAYDRIAEIIGEYCKKGKPVYIEGRLKTRKWQDKDGIERYTTEIVVESLQLLGGRDDGSAPPQERSAPRREESRRAPAPKAGGFDDMDDNIPF